MDATTPLYKPLNSAKSEVRLLFIIFQDKETNTVYCKLSTASLDTAPQYSALSYQWKLYEEEPERVRVIVNDREVSTTRNLGLALLELVRGRLYWIDAICINQSDVVERGKQVRLMTRIYSQAELVEIWLGRIEGNSNLGMALLWETNQSVHRETVEKVVKKRLPDLKYRSHWEGICNIMDRSYFTRLWIIQEVVLAQRQDQVMLHCGSCAALWTDLCNIAHCVTQIGSRYNWGADSSHEDRMSFDIGKRAPKILALDSHASNLASKNSLDRSGGKNEHVARQTDLLCLLTDYCRNDVTDDRDRIYGLLGVALEYPGVQLEINYSRSVEKVYAEAARYMVQGTKRLDILLFCRHWGVEEPLPSWVPDWRVPYEIQGPHEKWHLEKHDASGGTSAVASFSPDLKVLRVKSILLGPIKSAIPWNHWMRDLTGPNTDGYEKMTVAGEIEIFRWITFGISSFDEGELEGYNQRSEKEVAIRAVFEALTYGWIGQHALISTWLFEKFLTYYLRLSYKMKKRLGCDIPLWKAETSQILEGIDMKQKLFSLDIRHENTETTPGFPLRRTLGNCHKDAKVGDTVAIVLGCKHPVLLHKEGDKYELTHGLYLYGYMHGEAIGKYNEVDIELI